MKKMSHFAIILATGLLLFTLNPSAWAAQCANGATVKADMSIIIPCIEIDGYPFQIELKYYSNPDLPEGYYWQLDETSIIISSVDADGDGFSLPDDCDDSDPDIHPGATEIPGDKIDQDCIPFPFD